MGRFGVSERKQNNAEISAYMNKIAILGEPNSMCGDVQALSDGDQICQAVGIILFLNSFSATFRCYPDT